MTQLGVIDYRKDGHVIVEEGDDNTFIVTLKFFFSLTAEDYTDTYDAGDICLKQCTKYSHQVAKDFRDLYNVLESKWLEPTVFQMKIEKPERYSGDVYDLKYMYGWLRYDCLEDTFYEGDAEDNFWCVPMEST